MSWHFSSTDYDSRTFKDPTQLTVQPHTSELSLLQVFVREILQNSLDNTIPDRTARVDFRLEYCEGEKKEAFLNNLKFPQIQKHLDSVIEYQKKETERILFPSSSDILEDKYPMKILYIEDYGTRGLVGPESERERDRFDRPHCFLGLCRNVGDSQKGKEMLGGTYGLGKTVLWKLSRINLVMFYSKLSDPYNKIDDPADYHSRFFGQIRLPGHDLGDNAFKGEGFFGNRLETLTSSLFNSEAEAAAESLGFKLRSREETGTSILIVDFDDPDVDDDKEIASETTENMRKAAEKYFWPAIVDDRLSIRCRAESSENQEWTTADPENNADLTPYILAYNTAKDRDSNANVKLKELEVTIPKGPKQNDKKSRAIIQTATVINEDEALHKSNLTNTTALIRGAGMVVGYRKIAGRGFGAKDFFSVVLGGIACPNDSPGGTSQQKRCEELLGSSEPVSHDNWLPSADRLKGWYGAAAGIRRINENIVRIVSELTTHSIKPEGQAAPLLSRLFPLESGSSSTSDRHFSIQFLAPPSPSLSSNNELQYGFTLRIGVPAKNVFKIKPAPSKWQLKGNYGFCGEGNRRKIVSESKLAFTHYKRKHGSEWQELDYEYIKGAVFFGKLENDAHFIDIKGITNVLDKSLALTTKHELQITTGTSGSGEELNELE